MMKKIFEIVGLPVSWLNQRAAGPRAIIPVAGSSKKIAYGWYCANVAYYTYATSLGVVYALRVKVKDGTAIIIYLNRWSDFAFGHQQLIMCIPEAKLM